MKKTTIACMLTAITMTMAWAISANAEEIKRGPDMSVEAQFLLPQDSDNWTGSYGLQAKARFWQKGNFGTALCIGLQSWQAKSEYTEESDENETVSSTVYGNMTLLPIGASLLYRNAVAEDVCMTMEAGIRYAFTDSNLNVEIAKSAADGTSYQKEKILSDSPLLGILGLSFDASLDDDLTVLFGFAYQFDLSHPRESFMGGDMGPVSYKSPMVSIGLSWKF